MPPWQDTPRAHSEISSLLRPSDHVKREAGGKPPEPVLCLRFSGSIFVMPLAVAVGVVALIFGAALGYWIRHQHVGAEILAEKRNSENLATQLAQREVLLRNRKRTPQL